MCEILHSRPEPEEKLFPYIGLDNIGLENIYLVGLLNNFFLLYSGSNRAICA